MMLWLWLNSLYGDFCIFITFICRRFKQSNTTIHYIIQLIKQIFFPVFSQTGQTRPKKRCSSRCLPSRLSLPSSPWPWLRPLLLQHLPSPQLFKPGQTKAMGLSTQIFVKWTAFKRIFSPDCPRSQPMVHQSTNPPGCGVCLVAHTFRLASGCHPHHHHHLSTAPSPISCLKRHPARNAWARAETSVGRQVEEKPGEMRSRLLQTRCKNQQYKYNKHDTQHTWPWPCLSYYWTFWS